MEDQQICNFWFKITPTEIIPNAKIKTNVQKSVLIKLGNKEAKCKTIGTSIQMNVEVLYSKTLNKFCPIKGIIKVYDVNKDGSEMILCVGAFNTEDLLSEKPKITYLQRDIGSCKVLMTVQVKKIEDKSSQSILSVLQKQSETNQNQKSNKQPEMNLIHENNDHPLRSINRSFVKTSTISENQCRQSPYLMDDSTDNIQDTGFKQFGRLDIAENERRKYLQENNELIKEINILKQQLSVKNSQLAIKQQNLKKKIEEIVNLEEKIKKLTDEKKSLEGINQYLQERDAQMQALISNKENTIQNLSKIVTQNNTQLDSLEEKNNKLVKIVNNLELTVEEMKEQNANLLQTIESYRQKFGDLKAAKDKALEREIKQCLRWIDQQNRDEQLSLQETTLEFSQAPAVTSIMRSIGEIQNMPFEQICLIRKEVIGVLKRLDEFVAKNSLGGMTQ